MTFHLWHNKFGGAVRTDRTSYQKTYYETNKEDRKARKIVNLAVENGEIEQEPCMDCGETEKVIPFHYDPVNEPLEFDWVCGKCNKKRLTAIEDEIARWDKEYDERQKYHKF